MYWIPHMTGYIQKLPRTRSSESLSNRVPVPRGPVSDGIHPFISIITMIFSMMTGKYWEYHG